MTYTPTTEQVKQGYAYGLSGTSRSLQECDEEFDRWLQGIKAEAWDEGFGNCWHYHVSEGMNGTTENPYRKGN